MPSRRALLAVALLQPAAARAQTGPLAQREAIRRAVDGHVLPRHVAFAEAAQDFAAAAAAAVLRGAPDPAAREAARAAWRRAAIAFQGVRHLRFGPMEYFDRSYRLAFFPDPRNSIGREMAALLRATDPAALGPEAFARGSVAAQGLPAAERLLFGEEAALLLEPGQAPRRALLAAIGRNVEEIASGLLADWTRPGAPYGQSLEGAPGGTYRTPRDGLVALFKSLYGGLEFAAERQVARVLGPSAAEAFPRRAEAWRSGESLALVRAALAAQEELWRTGFAPLMPAAAAERRVRADAGFAAMRAAAQAVGPSLEVAVTQPAGRAAVEALLREAGALRRLLAEQVAPALDLPVGFNSLDGD